LNITNALGTSLHCADTSTANLSERKNTSRPFGIPLKAGFTAFYSDFHIVSTAQIVCNDEDNHGGTHRLGRKQPFHI
jgi:hypothetical protein